MILLLVKLDKPACHGQAGLSGWGGLDFGQHQAYQCIIGALPQMKTFSGKAGFA
ncbi:hypothetical protein [Advenella faeciporci]|uniref:hypothetical protein n=1 Tax=Advenella faeciporci TaxID=797535 RepID=UPI0016741947|nr:hypothetical protein [Advenella faeciporci]NLY34965.1 hypothetical protein [Alcaligenaceae bacterium]